jgi:hypothetical protein
MTGSSSENEARALNRRTVLQGAAWTVPVVAMAAATPMAAASGGGGTLTAAFIVVGDLGPTSTTIAGGIFIRNSSGAAVTVPAGNLVGNLTGFESATAPYISTVFDTDAADELGENSGPPANGLFSITQDAASGTVVIISVADITIGGDSEILIAFYMNWEASNDEDVVFVIGGEFTIDYGGAGGSEIVPIAGSVQVEENPDI